MNKPLLLILLGQVTIICLVLGSIFEYVGNIRLEWGFTYAFFASGIGLIACFGKFISEQSNVAGSEGIVEKENLLP